MRTEHLEWLKFATSWQRCPPSAMFSLSKEVVFASAEAGKPLELKIVAAHLYSCLVCLADLVGLVYGSDKP